MHDRSPARILVADDSRDTADVYGFLLGSVGYRVQRAYDGLTALCLAKVVKPDLAILNYKMPNLNGLQVLRELHACGVRTKVLITSGTADFEKLYASAIAEGAEACIHQPCPTEHLLAMVARALASHAPRDAQH